MFKIRDLLLLAGVSVSSWFLSPSLAVAACGARDLQCLRSSFRASITPQQEQQLAALRLAYMRELVLLRARLRMAKVELSYALTASEVDPQLLDAKIRTVGDIQADILRKRSEYHLNLRSKLSRTQAAWMDQITLLRASYTSEQLRDFSKRYERRRQSDRFAPPAVVKPPAEPSLGEAEPPSLGPSKPGPVALVSPGELAPDHPKEAATSQPASRPVAPMEPQGTEEEEGEEEGEPQGGDPQGTAPQGKQPPASQPSQEEEEDDPEEVLRGGDQGAKDPKHPSEPGQGTEEEEEEEPAAEEAAPPASKAPEGAKAGAKPAAKAAEVPPPVRSSVVKPVEKPTAKPAEKAAPKK